MYDQNFYWGGGGGGNSKRWLKWGLVEGVMKESFQKPVAYPFTRKLSMLFILY